MSDYRINMDPVTGDITTITITDVQVSISMVHEGEVLATGADHAELAANVKAALTEAHAQGAAEERERLINDAEKGNSIDDIVALHWLRSNTGEHHD